jgi:hypothetical protein
MSLFPGRSIYNLARSIVNGDILRGIMSHWTWIAIAIILFLFVMTFRYMMSLIGY